LIQIVDAAMADAARRGGPWVTCRLGCHECCEGPFEINALDARRLADAWLELRALRPAEAEQIRQRALAFQGHDEEPCPVLDRSTGGCLLYPARPMICRTFGPAVLDDSGAIAVCHLNYTGASDPEVLAAAVVPDPDGWEGLLLDDPSLQHWADCASVPAAIIRAAAV
jgi:Fe-S-cluster containining protein